MKFNSTNRQDGIAVLIGHCHVYLYGAAGSPEILFNEVAKSFYSFALLHLISTMFIIKDDSRDSIGGVFHRILDRLGLEELLSEVDAILALPVGRTTLKEYIRQKRNKLATHGTLLLETEKEEISEVSLIPEYVDQYTEGMSQLDLAVGDLNSKLEKIYEELG